MKIVLNKMRQESIVKWTNKSLIIKPYFYLESPFKAVWCKEKPDNVKWIQTVKIGFREISLCCFYKPTLENENFGSLYDSFLLSHLQKAIRRKNNRAAIFTADLLLEISPLKLLRRLPIIMIEDTFPHHSFTTLVWLIC